MHANANAFDAYWSQEALPVLNAGFHAPLGDGFTQFLRVPAVAKQVQSALAAELAGGGRGARTTATRRSPSACRCARSSPAPPRADANDPAVSLLRDPGAVEKQLLAAIAREGAKARFEPVAWDDVPERVLLPQWEAMARKASPVLATRLLADLPKLVARGRRISSAPSTARPRSVRPTSSRRRSPARSVRRSCSRCAARASRSPRRRANRRSSGAAKRS